MTNKMLKLAAVFFTFAVASIAHATTDWSAQDYDLYPGDFDGDGKTDILYIAKDPSKPSGIATSDGTAPNVPWQTWPGNYLGIPWSGNAYNVIVADFNGDGRDDIFLQKATAGDHYLLLTDASGKITGISQCIGNTAMGVSWSGDQHKIIAGNFNGDLGVDAIHGRADLFLQATSQTGLNAVVLADANGTFTSSTPAQSWTDSGAPGGIKWSTQSAIIYFGDFNGDGRSDLLVQAKPVFVMIDYEVPFPVPTYPANMNGVFFGQNSTSAIFSSTYSKEWSRTDFGVDWSPLTSTLVVGDFSGDGKADVLLQGKYSGRASYLVLADGTGNVFSSSNTAVSSNIALTRDSYRLMAGNFNGTSGVGLYYQALSPTGTNYATNDVGSSTTASAHSPSNATGTVPATAVGHTAGSFAVSNSGAATYSIPIAVPPGVSGIQPSLAITYNSGAGDGLLGVGWNLSGLSTIDRCKKTLAQDGSNDAVALTIADLFCLDGNKLRLTSASGTYGQAGSTYQTELETFSRITYDTASSSTAYFKVEGKDGLYYEYGNTNDSRIESTASGYTSTSRVWALNKVSDRSGNTMTISYYKDGSPNGSFRPNEINYTSNSNAGLGTSYKVKFVYEARPSADVLASYFAGGLIKETSRLSRIETQYNDPSIGSYRLVRKYQLSYNNSNVTQRSRLNAIQECDGGGNCLSPTSISWQDGLAAFTGEQTASNVGTLSASAIPMDIDGDGRTDIVYPCGSNWCYMLANASGGYDSPVDTYIGHNNNYATALQLDYNLDGKADLLVGDSNGKWQILQSTGSGFNTIPTTYDATGSGGQAWVADLNGDGWQDLVFVSGTSLLLRLGSATGFEPTTTTIYTLSNTQNQSYWYQPQTFDASGATRSSIQFADFNGDGRTDLIIGVGSLLNQWATYYGHRILLSNANSTYSDATTVEFQDYSKFAAWTVLDVNGDGIADIVHPCLTTSFWCVRFGTGAGIGPEVNTGISWSSSTPYLETFDTNGDGRMDMLFAGTTGHWQLMRGTADPAAPFGGAFDTGIPSSNAARTMLADVNGDGQMDLVYSDASGNLYYRLRNGSIADLVASVSDGFGNTFSVKYAPLTDDSVYAKGSGATYPELDIKAPIYVVKRYTASDGVGGSYSVDELFGTARVNLKGRGFEGFGWRLETDNRTGIKTATAFRQDFPYVGRVISADVSQPAPNNKVIASTSINYLEVVTSSTQYNDRHYPYVSSTTQTSREVSATDSSVDGALVKSVSTTVSNVDAYGNAGTIAVTTNDLTGSGQTFTATTTNTITNDSGNWCLGFVTQQQVATSVPNAESLYSNATPTRTLKFDPDPDAAKCRVYKQTIEPNTASQVATTFLFDSFGHVRQTTVSASGVADRIATADYGAQGVYPVHFTNAASEDSHNTYDYALGVPLTATDANGLQVTWTYDGFGRKTYEYAKDGTQTAWILSSCGIATSYCGDSLLRYVVQRQQLDGSANLVRTDLDFYDSANRVLYSQTQSLSGAYSVVRSIYNNRGQLVQRSAPYFYGFYPTYTSYSYDLLGRLSKVERRVSDADASIQSIQYSYAKLNQSVTDPLGHTTTQMLNAIGQVVQATDANSSVTQYAYDPLGNLAKTTDSAGNQIKSSYDIRGFKRTSDDPDMGHWSYTYYPTGELYTQTDAKNQTASFTYDAISRPRTRVEPEGTTEWTYGSSSTSSSSDKNIGQLRTVTSQGGYAETYYYDSSSRPKTITYAADATYQVDYAYNNQGTLDTLTYPTSTAGYRLKLQYAYANGLLAQIRDYSAGTQFLTLNATNAASQAIDESMANGVKVISGFDSVNGSLGYRQSGNGGSTSNLQNLTYLWDKAGNLKQRQDTLQNITEVFNYDALNRLDYSTLNGTQNLDVTVNAIGNLTYKSDVSSSSFDYTTQQSGCTYYSYSQPHAVRKVGSNVYCYDANGNMTSRGGSSISWTSYNLPSQINSGSNYSQFSYGANRQRWKQVANYSGTTETTVYVGGLMEKVTRNGVTEYKHYIAGNSATAIYTRRSDNTTSTYYVSSDHLGSADVITDGSGAAVVRESFAAYGARRGSNWTGQPSSSDQGQFAATTRHGYTGHEMLDNLDLTHMNGRVYDQQIGRFLSADPYIQAPMNQQSLNRYSYVMNGPMSATDPSGYFSLKSLLNPFSKDSPLSISSTVGRLYASAGLGALPYLDYQIHQAGRQALKNNPELQPIAMIVAGIIDVYAGYPITTSLLSADLKRMNGGSAFDVLNAFSTAVATSYAFSALGYYTSDYPMVNTIGHAAVGCASEAAGGGSCAGGAASAGFGAAFSNFTPAEISGSFVGAMVAGGIGSELAGGDFWQGAQTAGLGFLLNSFSHRIMQHEMAVAIAEAQLEEQGMTIRGTEVYATTEGLDYSRRYDIVAVNPENQLVFGVEVKSSSVGIFRLDRRQAAFDAFVVMHGGYSPRVGPINGVMYRGVDFSGKAYAIWRSVRQMEYMQEQGIPFYLHQTPRP